ncbi:hypothetical protein RB213_004878 [Colletotrichum asianum]
MPQDEEYTYEDFDSLEIEMSTDLNDGKPVVSYSWVMQSNGYQPDIVDHLLAYTDNFWRNSELGPRDNTRSLKRKFDG